MKNYEVLEDNGGGIYLAVFTDEDKEKVEYLHAGYEFGPSDRLSDDLEALRNGDDPAKDWDGNAENPQELYDQLTSYEYGWEVIADNDGVYPEKMGAAGQLCFSQDIGEDLD